MSVQEEGIKVFDKWSVSNVTVRDPGLRGYICLTPVFLPHSGGRHEHRRFGKAKVFVVERLINRMMRPGKNAGKKILATNIVKTAFELIHLKTKENPIQVLIRAIENAAPREEITRISYGGIVYPQSVDAAPQRRVDLAIRFITDGARMASFSNIKPIEECLADEIIAASRYDPKSYAIQRKEEIERIAVSAR